MPYTVEQIKELLQAGESETVEFKRTFRDRDRLATLMAAFANTHGGRIIVGVEEPATIVGTDTRRLQHLFQQAYSVLQPPPIAQYDTVAIDGKDVAIIQVERSPSLVLANTGAYRRVGASVVAMSASMIAQMLQDSVHTPTETDNHLPTNEPGVIVGEAVLVEEGDTLTATGTLTEDPIAIGIANITTEVAHLKAQLAETTGWQAQWENYLVGGVVGAVISLAFTNGAGAVVAVIGVAAIVIIRLVRSRRGKVDKN